MSIDTRSKPNHKEDKRRKKKEAGCPTGLSHCDRVYELWSSISEVNTTCHHLFISLLGFFLRFKHLTFCCFTFELGLGIGENNNDVKFLFITRLLFGRSDQFTLDQLGQKCHTYFYIYLLIYTVVN
jgi:hypothetical protein